MQSSETPTQQGDLLRPTEPRPASYLLAAGRELSSLSLVMINSRGPRTRCHVRGCPWGEQDAASFGHTLRASLQAWGGGGWELARGPLCSMERERGRGWASGTGHSKSCPFLGGVRPSCHTRNIPSRTCQSPLDHRPQRDRPSAPTSDPTFSQLLSPLLSLGPTPTCSHPAL